MVGRTSSEPGINAFRFVNMFAIVMAHAWWFVGPMHHGDPRYFLLITAQCSVPTFFMTSGYFLRWREGDPFAVARWSLCKLLPLYAIWAAIYTITAWLVGMGPLLQLVSSIGFGATALHLWFLPALALALSSVSVSLRFLGFRATLLWTVALAAFGLFSGVYQMFLGFGAHPLRACIVTAPMLVLVGIWLRTADLPRWPVVFGLAVLLTYYLQVWDDRLIATAAGYSSDKRTAVSLATIPYALSVFLFARSLPRSAAIEWLDRRKGYLLVIYCIHPMVLTGIGRLWHHTGLGIALVVTAIAYAISLLAAVLLATARQRMRTFAISRPRFAVHAGADG